MGYENVAEEVIMSLRLSSFCISLFPWDSSLFQNDILCEAICIAMPHSFNGHLILPVSLCIYYSSQYG